MKLLEIIIGIELVDKIFSSWDEFDFLLVWIRLNVEFISFLVVYCLYMDWFCIYLVWSLGWFSKVLEFGFCNWIRVCG